MDYAYLVQGETGEYSDHSQWPVRFCPTQGQADDLCAELNDWCVANKAAPGQGSRYNRPTKHPLDPQFSCDYTGTIYRVIQVPCA